MFHIKETQGSHSNKAVKTVLINPEAQIKLDYQMQTVVPRGAVISGYGSNTIPLQRTESFPCVTQSTKCQA